MNYEEFKNFLLENDSSKDIYVYLVKKYGINKINNLFEHFICDDSIEDIDYKLSKASYYLEIKYKDEDIDTKNNNKKEDSDITECTNHKLLTPEEEKIALKKITKYHNVLKRHNIDPIKFLNNFKKLIISLGYTNGIKNNTTNNLENEIAFFEKYINKENNNTKKNIQILKIAKYCKNYLIERNNFINANLKLVYKNAKMYYCGTIDMDDLIEYGNAGLIIATNKFQIMKDTKFSTYATWWIKQSIMRNICNSSKAIRIPVHTCDNIYRVKKAKEIIVKEKGFVTDNDILEYFRLKTINNLKSLNIDNITDEMIEKNNPINKKALEIVNKYDYNIVSTSTPITEDNDDITIEDFLTDETVHIEKEIINKIDCENLIKILITLKPQNKIVLALRYGIPLNKVCTLEEFIQVLIKIYNSKNLTPNIEYFTKIYDKNSQENSELHTLNYVGEILHVSRERIRQIEAKELNKIRNSSISNILKEK